MISRVAAEHARKNATGVTGRLFATRESALLFIDALIEAMNALTNEHRGTLRSHGGEPNPDSCSICRLISIWSMSHDASSP